MCGINGLFMLGGNLPNNAYELVSKMNFAIKHRGPDDSGVWVSEENGIAFGQQRLSILDLSSAGHQPMINDQNDAIVFNGEIYNYQEIKSTITNYNFKTGTDTEVLQLLYHQNGHKCLPTLNGMFALAFYDNKSKLLKIARDRAGKKPLYYSIKNGIFAFSSEIKALLTLPWISPEVDNESLYDFLTYNQLDAPQTMFKGINKLAPGTYMTIK
jgi:asparagine synthase (glutamine-hydrolysing)